MTEQPMYPRRDVPARTAANRASLAAAIRLHQNGETLAAEKAYQQILAEDRQHDEAMHLLGLLMHESGQAQLAISLVESAVRLSGGEELYRFNLAEILRAQGRNDEAAREYQILLQSNSMEADYWFGLGSALLESGDYPAAITNLREATNRAPRDAEIRVNLGCALAEDGQLDAALKQLDQAIRLDPQNADALASRGNARKLAGDYSLAIDDYRRALRCRPGDAEIYYNLGLAHDENGQLGSAETAYRQALDIDAGLLRAWLNLAHLLLARNQDKSALQAYGMALARDPDMIPARLGIAAVYRDGGDTNAAAENYRYVLSIEPGHVAALNGLADCLIKFDENIEALSLLDHALTLDSNCAEAHFNRGLCLQALGRFEEAVEAHCLALDLRPNLADAAYNLTLIRSDTLDDEQLDRFALMGSDESQPVEARINLQFALARAYRDRGMRSTGFEFLKLGNELKAAQKPFDPEIFNRYIDRVIATCDFDFFTQRQGFGCPSERPLFIVGMPRSGSTLVEQIVASHPDVHGAGELNDMRLLLKNLPRQFDLDQEEPECVAELSRKEARILAGQYLRRLEEMAPDALRIADKMLGNFLKLGFIWLMFPQARVIHCLRDERDMALSCFEQNFARGLRFSFDLEHLAIACHGYQRLMTHWRKVLPMKMLEISYEDLVGDQLGMSRRLIGFCELAWDPGCLEFYRAERSVKTASFWQVRQPLYASSVGRWREYESELKPFSDKLAELQSTHAETAC